MVSCMGDRGIAPSNGAARETITCRCAEVSRPLHPQRLCMEYTAAAAPQGWERRGHGRDAAAGVWWQRTAHGPAAVGRERTSCGSAAPPRARMSPAIAALVTSAAEQVPDHTWVVFQTWI